MQSSPHALTEEQMLDVMEMAGYSLFVTRHEGGALRLMLQKGDFQFFVDNIKPTTPESEMKRMAFDFFLEAKQHER